MILYFADRTMAIIGQASTGLPDGLLVQDDDRLEEIEKSCSTFECRLSYAGREERAAVEDMTRPGNYILRQYEGGAEYYTIIDSEIDTDKDRKSVV